ncbi:MAG: AMP-binding protein, partial [Rhodospirillales bacterium]|nr:AMP-binding protein [Rhodospirillales bacterium]
MSEAKTIIELLDAAAGGKNVAISAPDRPDLSHAGLRDLAERTVKSLNEVGIGRGDRISIVLPNGPEMATAFITIATCATTAPLNPSYREDEYKFYLEDLQTKALVVEEGSTSPSL